MSNKLAKINNQLAQKNEMLIIARSMVEHRPKLAIAVESKKIRDYSNDDMIPVMKGGTEVMVSEKQYKQEALITYILMLLGITETQEKEKIEHYAMLDLFIQEDYGSYTYEEIKEAFKMAIKGEFDEFKFKLIHKLDAKIFGEVMKYYTVIKNRKLRVYEAQVKKHLWNIEQEKNRPTDEQINKQTLIAVMEEFSFYKESGNIEVCRIYLYDWLYERNILPKDKETKQSVFNYAKGKFKERKKYAISREEKMLLEIFDKKGKVSPSLLSYCKQISLGRYFDRFTTKEQLNKNIIKHIKKNLKR